MSPRGFLEGVRELGFDDVTEMEAACLMKVLAKPELDGSVILNEFILIMENFGIPVVSEDDEYENDYIPDSDSETKDEEDKALADSSKPTEENEKEKAGADAKDDAAAKSAADEDHRPAAARDSKHDGATDGKDAKEKEQEENKEVSEKSLEKAKAAAEARERLKKAAEQGKAKKVKHPIDIKFGILDDKALRILKKLARFLLERYMHPREFFGPTIKKETIGKKKCKVEIIKLHDFYLRLKLASIRKKLKENTSLNLFVAIDGSKYPDFVQVKRLIKALEIIAEGEQELMVKEQEAKDKEAKEKAEQEAKERAEKGLPPLVVEEEKPVAKETTPKAESKGFADQKKGDGIVDGPAGKPPIGGRSALDEMLKLGGKGSPQNGREREGNRFASHLGPSTQLNTIEEDLHETQTSHYSQQVKEGDGSDRDGSRHQLSTSNQLRNSNALHELEDSARRSGNGLGGRGSVPHGVSVQSADYSGGGSQTSPKKPSTKALEVRHSMPGNELVYPLDIDEADQRMKDELDAEVDKKYKRQLASSQDVDHKGGEADDDDYEEDFENKEDNNDMREDTIKTDKIEQIVDDDMRMKDEDGAEDGEGPGDKRLKAARGSAGELSGAEGGNGDTIGAANQSIDELDVHAKLDGEGPVPLAQQQHNVGTGDGVAVLDADGHEREEDDEEYSYNDNDVED